ncbi:hypothetical protein SAMN05192539_104247 [Paraburkholderia diazotrophica]|uniref:Uncharacterized protein n=1 Tax=Paraburkholderia diazotrophica TaxID=667676 RepID=A0A1H7E4L7_9BURK|nr:hypothetical protein SAMN05192539_104247 [Paraburkholderia diazotrophica]
MSLSPKAYIPARARGSSVVKPTNGSNRLSLGAVTPPRTRLARNQSPSVLEISSRAFFQSPVSSSRSTGNDNQIIEMCSLRKRHRAASASTLTSWHSSTDIRTPYTRIFCVYCLDGIKQFSQRVGLRASMSHHRQSCGRSSGRYATASRYKPERDHESAQRFLGPILLCSRVDRLKPWRQHTPALFFPLCSHVRRSTASGHTLTTYELETTCIE